MQELEGYVGWYENVTAHLENVTVTKRQNGFKSVFGHLGNLRVKVDERGVGFQGSMAKFLYGNNFVEITRDDLSDFIECLSDTLNIDMGQAIVRRLDFGKNIICDYQPKTYTKLFTESRYYERHVHPYSVHYINGNRQFIMYDKIVQAKKEGDTIPDELRNKYVLRLEARLVCEKRIRQDLGDENRLINLQKKATWDKMAEVWETMYFHFNKEKEVHFDYAKIKKLKNVDDYYRAKGFKADGGLLGLNQKIEILKKAESLKHPSYYSNLKRNYKTLVNKLSKGNENQFILELDEKVKAAR